MKIWAVNAVTAAKQLKDPVRFGVTAMLSIRGLEDPPISPEGPSLVPVFELRFQDVARGRPEGPDAEIVGQGIEWLRDHVDGVGTLVIHCRQGISRSAAFAAIALYLQGVPESQVFNRLSEHVAHGSPSPNADVLQIADELLGSSLLRWYKRDMSGNFRMWSLCNS